MVKKCSRCDAEKELDLFHKGKRFGDGHNCWCKKCIQEYSVENSESIKENKRKWYESKMAKTEKERAEKKERRLLEAPAKKEKALEKKRKYVKQRSGSAAKKLSDKKHRESHKQQRNEKDKKRKSEDIQYRLTINLRVRLNKAIKNDQKNGSAIKDLGCTVEFLKFHLESQFYEAMSWDNYGHGPGKWQIDHVAPFCSLDLTDKEQLLKACNYKNLQPLWYKDHVQKTIEDIKLAA